MASHSSIPAWKLPCTDEPERLQSVGSERVRHDRAPLPLLPPMDTLFSHSQRNPRPYLSSENSSVGKTRCREKIRSRDPLIKKEKTARPLVHELQLHHSIKIRLPSLTV